MSADRRLFIIEEFSATALHFGSREFWKKIFRLRFSRGVKSRKISQVQNFDFWCCLRVFLKLVLGISFEFSSGILKRFIHFHKITQMVRNFYMRQTNPLLLKITDDPEPFRKKIKFEDGNPTYKIFINSTAPVRLQHSLWSKEPTEQILPLRIS